MGGLIQSETVHVPTAQTTTPTTKHAAMCMRMFSPPFTMDRNVDVAALFGAAKPTICRVLPVLFDMDCRQVS